MRERLTAVITNCTTRRSNLLRRRAIMFRKTFLVPTGVAPIKKIQPANGRVKSYVVQLHFVGMPDTH